MLEKMMNLAMEEALKAYKHNEVPIGCVIVKNDKIIAKGHNNREKRHNILGHAEVMAIKKASKKLKTWKLDDCIMYVTLKPCSMCESIIKQSRIKEVYYILDKLDFKNEYSKTTFTKTSNEYNYDLILKEFFNNKRRQKQKDML